MGFAVIPGSKNVNHIKDNLDIFDFTLTDDEMTEIAKLDKGVRYYNRTDEQRLPLQVGSLPMRNNYLQKILSEKSRFF